jgi:hypothetical protein
MDRNVILSFGIDRERLADREAALRQAGFEVISVSSEMQAHFEIEMGRCGLLLMCYRTSPLTACELTTVFRKHSPNGRIIYVMNSARGAIPVSADMTEFQSQGTKAISQTMAPDPFTTRSLPEASSSSHEPSHQRNPSLTVPVSAASPTGE